MNNKDALDYWQGKKEAQIWARRRVSLLKQLDFARESATDPSTMLLLDAIDFIFYELDLHYTALVDLTDSGEEE